MYPPPQSHEPWAMKSHGSMSKLMNPNVGALIIRIGFGGIIYYNYDKEPPKIVLVIT